MGAHYCFFLMAFTNTFAHGRRGGSAMMASITEVSWSLYKVGREVCIHGDMLYMKRDSLVWWVDGWKKLYLNSKVWVVNEISLYI